MFSGQNANFVQDYCIDACQRAILTLDALRERGNTALKRSTELAPHVLQFDFEVVRDGRTLDKPVNYVLIRIVPPAGTAIDPAKAPFIVFDPRAGHGPGIGGMKQDSEIGVALAAGHSCYFVGFLPQPVPGQTIADVCRAQAQFVTDVAERHPEAEGKPVLIGNCQAGWQIMMTAALRPDLMGPIVIVGSPLSYWAGVRGRSPMRADAGSGRIRSAPHTTRRERCSWVRRVRRSPIPTANFTARQTPTSQDRRYSPPSVRPTLR